MNKENINELSEGELSEVQEGVKIIEYKSRTPALDAEFVEGIGKRIELRATMIRQALKALKPHDIIDFDGKPYIEGEGAARIMAVVRGFKVGETKFEIEHIPPHYFIECSIPIEFMGATTVAIGDCSTQDSFFCGKEGKTGRFAKYKEQTGSDTIAARLLLGDAKKKARENAISRGVSELLGLKGLTWDDLKELGFERAGAGATVAFKGGKKDVSPPYSDKHKTPLSIKEALQQETGGFDVEGQIDSIKGRITTTGKALTDYVLVDSDEQHVMLISVWGECKESFSPRTVVVANNIKVSKYQGKSQYVAEAVASKQGEEHALGD